MEDVKRILKAFETGVTQEIYKRIGPDLPQTAAGFDCFTRTMEAVLSERADLLLYELAPYGHANIAQAHATMLVGGVCVAVVEIVCAVCGGAFLDQCEHGHCNRCLKRRGLACGEECAA